MNQLLVIGALAALLAAPTAHAAYVSTGELTGAFDGVAPVETPEMPILYVTDAGDVWQESNGFDGLQSEAVQDEEGNPVAEADTFLLGASMVPLPPL